jgi:hypothetical protein
MTLLHSDIASKSLARKGLKFFEQLNNIIVVVIVFVVAVIVFALCVVCPLLLV